MKQFDIKKTFKERLREKRPKESKLPYLLGILLALVLAFGFILWRSQPKTQEVEEIVFKEPKTEELVEGIKEEPTEVKVEETKKEVKEEEKTLDKSQIKIQVLNGNGIRGDAYRTKMVLEKDGWKVKSIGNASSFKYLSTLVYYKEGQEEVGKEVGETLKKNKYQTTVKPSEYLKLYDVLVIVGKK